MSGFICKACKEIAEGKISVGILMDEGDNLRKSGKLKEAMDKYFEAHRILSKNDQSHDECVKCAGNEYEAMFKNIAGSRS